MSAYLVEKTTIDRVVAAIDFEQRRNMYFRTDLEKGLDVDFADATWRNRLGQKMWDLNQLAFNYRYGERQKNLRYEYCDICQSFSHVQSFKALRCWLYQCCEGDIPEKSRLYQFFEKKGAGYLAVRIVEESAEYEEAEWA